MRVLSEITYYRLSDYRLDKLTRPIIQRQVNKWANKANRGEKGAFKDYKYLANINKTILQYAVTMDLIETNPARDISVPRLKKQGKETIKHYTNQQVKQFLDYLDSLDQSVYKNLFDTVLYKLLLATGLRIGEALALEWSDIDFEHGIIPSDKSKVFVDGHELTLAQYTLFQMFKLTKEQQFTVVNTWYVCRDQGLRSYQIKQELFLKLHNIDLDFLIAIMKADLLCEEVSVFVDFLFDWVSECESAKEVEEIFNYLYFKLHPEIKKSILEDNLIWGIENNKILLNPTDESVRLKRKARNL